MVYSLKVNGILLIDKPMGWTSFDVVAKIRGTIKHYAKQQLVAMSSTVYPLLSTPSLKVKVGHTGTLDPLATGLLVIVVGDYCKRAGEFSKLDKTYEVTMKLGETSTTGDEEGEKTVSSEQRAVSIEELQKALGKFRGGDYASASGLFGY